VNITYKYTCKPCGIERVALEVPARQTESVTAWMDATVRRISADHRRRSPHCNARELTELLIPTTGTDKVGGPVVQ
jgi:hypothetical protein